MGEPLVAISSLPVKRAADQMRAAIKLLDATPSTLGDTLKQRVRGGIVGIYGPKLGAETNWEVQWTASAGTLGLLTVKSADPFVLGYEYGTQEHVILAQQAPLLGFYWYNQGANFLGEMVLHPGARPHNRLPYLVSYMRELGTWGWSGAVNAALKEAGYGGGDKVPGIPPTPRIFQPEAENTNVWQPDAPIIHGRSAAVRFAQDGHALDINIRGMMRAARRARGI